MTEVERIADQLRRAVEGEAWYGPPIRDVLARVSANQADARPIHGAHSIWEILLHMTAWEGVVLRRLEGWSGKLPDEEDWPVPPDADDAAWQEARDRFAEQNRRLQEAVVALTDARLDNTAPGTEYTFYFLMHGLIQHDLYHTGQIVLLERAQRG